MPGIIDQVGYNCNCFLKQEGFWFREYCSCRKYVPGIPVTVQCTKLPSLRWAEGHLIYFVERPRLESDTR